MKELKQFSWICPECGAHNKEPCDCLYVDIISGDEHWTAGCEISIKCEQCGEYFEMYKTVSELKEERY